MAGSKRASMREGPLAELFRKTDAAQRDGQEAPDAAPPGGRRPPGRGGPLSSTPADEASPAAETGGEPGPAEHADTARPARRTPTPQERLRQAFSADLPDDILVAPESPARTARERSPAAPASVAMPQLRVVGVGGGGVNAVNRMIEAGIAGIDFLALNTDAQSLQESHADIKLQIGRDVTRGLGSGADPEHGQAAAMEDYARIKALLKGADMVFVAAGEGGGTGTGAAPVVARIAREVGALSVAIVTKPFGFEGARRLQQAERGIQALSEEVDTLIVVPNNRLLSVLGRSTSMVQAFQVADDVLRQGVQGISDLITLPGLINLDFADVRTIMSDAGPALLGIGMGTGADRAVDAAQQAVFSPLLETSVDGARSILLSITGGTDLSLWEINEAAKTVQQAAHPDANIIFGAMVDDTLDDHVWVTVVATGYAEGQAARERNRGGAEPASEARASRIRDSSRSRPMEVEVPEFMPRR